MDELERWADRAARSTMVPLSLGKPDDIIPTSRADGQRTRPAPDAELCRTSPPSTAGRRFGGDAMLALCMLHPLSRRDRADRRRRRRPHRCCTAQRQGDPRRSASSASPTPSVPGCSTSPARGRNTRIACSRCAPVASPCATPSRQVARPDRCRGGERLPLESAGISAAPPVAEAPTEPRRTLGQFLDELEANLRAATTYEAVLALVEHPDTAGRRTRPATA